MKKKDLLIMGVSTLKKHYRELSVSLSLFDENVVFDMDTNEDTFIEYTLDEYISEIIIPTMEENLEILDITAEFVREYKRIYEKVKANV